MAEAVGLAASIAGLIGITGQLAKGVLFLKEFVEDTKNAPDYIRSLAVELELLGSAATKTDKLLVKCKDGGLDFDLEEERKGLKRYADMIENLGTKIEKDVKKFGSGKGRWWERVGSAGRKKGVEGYLVGVERAKTLVLDIGMKIMIQLQHDNRTSLINTTQTLETVQASSNSNTATIERIEVQASAITTWTGTTDQTLGSVLNGIERINSSLNTLSPVVQNLQHTGTTGPSVLETMLESAVMRGLKRHTQEMENNQRMDSNGTKDTTVMPRFCDTPTEVEDSNNRLYSDSYAMIRRDKTVYKSSFRTPFFDIEIETKEVQKFPRSKAVQPSLDSVSKFEPTHCQRVTKYQVRVKIPFWRGGMTFQSGNANMVYGGGFCKSFRTYNIVPDDAPIIEACRIFDLQEVRRLFEAGLASPFDRNHEKNESLVDIVLTRLFWGPWSALRMEVVELLQYLIACLGGDAGLINVIWRVLYRICDGTFHPDRFFVWEEALRLAMEHSSEDPFTGCDHYLSCIKITKTSLYPVLTGQQRWWLDNGINMDELFGGYYSDFWCETELQMLADPEALNLQAALKKSLQYIPFVRYNQDDFGRDVHLHLLLRIAFEALDDQDFQQCVIARLVIMLKSGSDERRVHLLEQPYQVYGTPATALSCTGYAQSLGLATLWRTSLERAGWSLVKIDDLFDEELYLGVPELIDGTLWYQTHDDNRKEFIETLRRGGFVDLEDSAVYYLARELQSQVDAWDFSISDMIIEVTSVMKRHASPGSWVDDEVINLMPGKDFALPRIYLNSDKLKKWKCIRDIWNEELDGCVPEGYEDSEDEHDSEDESNGDEEECEVDGNYDSNFEENGEQETEDGEEYYDFEEEIDPDPMKTVTIEHLINLTGIMKVI